MSRAGTLLFMAATLCAAAPGSAATGEPVPMMFQSAPGQFEVAAVDVDGAQRVVDLAAEAWKQLAVPLALPPSFGSPVFVRLVPAADWREPAPFRVIVEAGGVVSVWIRWEPGTRDDYVRRALVQGLLMRQAVARHGVSPRLTAPLWLELACVGWWRSRAEPAYLDALKQSTARFGPPAIPALLEWPRGRDEPAALTDGAVWLMTFLQAEAGRTGEWAALVQRLLGGDEPTAALAATFPGRFTSERDRELWWQTGWHHWRTARLLPGLEAAESRGELAELARFVFARAEADVVVPLREVMTRDSEPPVEAEVRRHAAALDRILPLLHPFYRNAALSLSEVLTHRGLNARKREVACATFEQDWRDAIELEIASTAALDALERKPSRAR